ncbi:MAG TPA: ComEC/Rec2 family competence protein [Candidatus Andersenbacteria bacterium]|nr:ComEC/Rec2 family competence protein [Candidatus Andersenbacteria bacterium]
MRARVCILILSWIVGMCAGVFQAVPILIGSCVLSLLAIVYYIRLSTPFFVAIALLVGMGFVYGNATVIPRAAACQGELVSYAILERTYSVSFNDAKYVFKRNDGCSILVSTFRFPLLVRGTQVRISGSQSYASIYLQDDGIDLAANHVDLTVIKKGTSYPDSIRIAGIERISQIFSEPDASIATAMLLGDRGTVSKDVQDVFRKSGISHLLAIAGLHVSILAGMLAFGIRFLPLPNIIRTIIMIGILWTYIGSIGAPLSAVRAGAFWTMYAVAYRGRLLIGMPTIILLLVAILMTIDPHVILSPALELSISAVLGIWAMVRIFHFRRSPLRSLFFVSLGATLGTLPLAIYYFGGFSLLGVFINMIIVPVVPAILISIILAVFASMIAIPFGLFFSFISHLLFSWVLFVSAVSERIPYAYIDSISIPGWAVFLYYAIFVFCMIGIMKRKRMRFQELWT